MLGNVFDKKIQCELYCPKSARKISGLSARNAHRDSLVMQGERAIPAAGDFVSYQSDYKC